MHDRLLQEVRGRRELMVKATKEDANFLLAAARHSGEGRERTRREEDGATRWTGTEDGIDGGSLVQMKGFIKAK